MLFRLRRAKHEAFLNEKVRQYLIYACGEILLVILGILIALQIDNWNEHRKQQATLQSYLQSIARNMREDLSELESLRKLRVESLYLQSRFMDVSDQQRFTEGDILLVSRLGALAEAQLYFNANDTGFDALKNSGVLNLLQGSGMEHLLSRYYDIVKRIDLTEHAANDQLGSLAIEVRRNHPAKLERWAMINPSSLTPERFAEVQPLFREVILNPTTQAMVDSHYYSRGQVLLYDSLKVLGDAFIRGAESGQLDAVDAMVRTPLEDYDDRLGTAEIITAGRPIAESYFLTTASEPLLGIFNLDSIQLRDGSMHVEYHGGAEWAVVYWSPMADNTVTGVANMDFSRFSKLRLELKGDRGGELIQVHVKDVDYPNDIGPVTVDLKLSAEWQTFEIDLAKFAPNDPSRLHTVLGFLLDSPEEKTRVPLGFSVRDARYQ